MFHATNTLGSVRHTKCSPGGKHSLLDLKRREGEWHPWGIGDAVRKNSLVQLPGSRLPGPESLSSPVPS